MRISGGPAPHTYSFPDLVPPGLCLFRNLLSCLNPSTLYLAKWAASAPARSFTFRKLRGEKFKAQFLSQTDCDRKLVMNERYPASMISESATLPPNLLLCPLTVCRGSTDYLRTKTAQYMVQQYPVRGANGACPGLFWSLRNRWIPYTQSRKVFSSSTKSEVSNPYVDHIIFRCCWNDMT